MDYYKKYIKYKMKYLRLKGVNTNFAGLDTNVSNNDKMKYISLKQSDDYNKNQYGGTLITKEDLDERSLDDEFYKYF